MAKLSSLHSSRFRRYPDEGWIAGVCAGLADFMGWNVRLIRALAVLTFVFSGFFPLVLVYGVLWYVMEETRGRPRPLGRGRDPSGDDHGPRPDFGGGGRYRESWRDDGDHRTRFGGHGMSSADLRSRFAHLDARLASMEECVTSHDYELRRELRKLER